MNSGASPSPAEALVPNWRRPLSRTPALVVPGLSSQACHPPERAAAAALLLVARGAGGDDVWRGGERRIGAIE